MIERYHFLKLKPEFRSDEHRRDTLTRVRAVLPTVPGVLSVTAGEPADEEAAAGWDVSIVVRFASLADVAPYRADPTHRRFVDEVLAPRVEFKKAWNFEVD